MLPWLIPRLKERGIVGRDLNKPGRPEIAEMGGIAVAVGFFVGTSTMVVWDGVPSANIAYASLFAIMGAALVGIFDDIFDLRQRFKAILPFLLALPLGSLVGSEVTIPHIAVIDFGPWMTLAAAFAVTCAANAANMLEGFNGLGAGLGIIMASTLVILCIEHNRLDGIYILAPLLGGLVVFLWFNKYPASVFPGDTMMLMVGAALACAGILSSLHVQTVFIFIPMISEFFLKMRGRFQGENYSTNAQSGCLEYSGKIESLTHLFMKRAPCTEKTLVYKVWSLEAVFCFAVIIVDLAVD